MSDGAAGSPDAPAVIEVTVKNVMTGKAETKVRVPITCTVRGLKCAISEKADVLPEKQLLLFNDKELRDDDAKICDLGMTTDCMITLSVLMSTGTEKSSGSLNFSFVLLPPLSLPSGPGLRNSVRGMTSIKARAGRAKKVEKTPEDAQVWTPEKKLEIELTRNRMKSLMRGRKKTNLLSPSHTPMDNGSVLASHASPIHTPPNEMIPGSTKNSNENAPTEEITEVTEKELKLFFEPMESLTQLDRLNRSKAMAPPPQNEKELEQLKREMEMKAKTCCKACGKKLPMIEQTIFCKCKNIFCRNHRNPKDHLCQIDYKQTGRTRLSKENPMLNGGGARKGKW